MGKAHRTVGYTRAKLARKMQDFTGRAPNFGGYHGYDPVSKRKYNWHKSVARFKREGAFANRWNGSGHRAGEGWAEEKKIDPESPVQRYSKNSPSFDEGVYTYKKITKAKREMMNNYLKNIAKETAMIKALP